MEYPYVSAAIMDLILIITLLKKSWIFDIKRTFSSVNHSRSNDSLERFHATLTEMMHVHMTELTGETSFNIFPYAVYVVITPKTEHGEIRH